ncbi:MAG: hypothetical protein NVSMB62_17980 [Acidobacteriaceae bacterium]
MSWAGVRRVSRTRERRASVRRVRRRRVAGKFIGLVYEAATSGEGGEEQKQVPTASANADADCLWE